MRKIDYNTDFYTWALYHAQLLRDGKLSELDVEHLIEELEDMGRSSQHELENRLVVLLGHLLKWGHQSEHRSSSWRGSINEQRLQIKRKLRKNPGLQPRLPEAVVEAYPDAVELAAKDTGIPTNLFPQACPYSLEEIMDGDFYPGVNEE